MATFVPPNNTGTTPVVAYHPLAPTFNFNAVSLPSIPPFSNYRFIPPTPLPGGIASGSSFAM